MNQRLAAALEELESALAHEGVRSGTPAAELLAETEALAVISDRVDAALAVRLHEIDIRQCTVAHAGVGTATWFSSVARAPRSRCTGLLRLARPGNAHLIDGVRHARLTTAQATAIARVTNAANASFMESIADQLEVVANTASSFEHFRALVADIANAADVEGRAPSSLDSRCWVRRVADSVVLNATLYGDDVNVVQHVLNEATNEIYASYPTGEPRPSRAQLMANALAQCCSRARTVDSGTKPKTHAVVVIDKDRPATSSALLCEADVEVLTTAKQVPLTLQRLRRFPTAAQRRVILHRDGGRVFPGCRAPSYITDIHHVIPWHMGGATNVDEMAALCRTHHTITHSPGWTMTTTPDGFAWTTPTGNHLLGQRHGMLTKPPP